MVQRGLGDNRRPDRLQSTFGDMKSHRNVAATLGTRLRESRESVPLGMFSTWNRVGLSASFLVNAFRFLFRSSSAFPLAGISPRRYFATTSTRFLASRHCAKFVRRAVAEPQAPPLDAIDELVRADPAAKEPSRPPAPSLRNAAFSSGVKGSCRRRSACCRCRSPERRRAALAVDESPVRALDQVRADIPRRWRLWRRRIRKCVSAAVSGGKADDDDVDVRLCPASLSQANVRWAKWILMPKRSKSVVPQRADLLALGDRIGGDETDRDLRVPECTAPP